MTDTVINNIEILMMNIVCLIYKKLVKKNVQTKIQKTSAGQILFESKRVRQINPLYPKKSLPRAAPGFGAARFGGK
jgi:hypothetical protein